MNQKILAWFSCGVTSAIACRMAIEQYGVENVDVVYIGIASAHEDNARFIRDCEKWMKTKIRTITSKDYEDQFDVIENTGYVNGAKGARCTLELKKKVRYEEQRRLGYPTQIFGFEFSLKEINRAVRFSQQHPEAKAIHLLIENSVTKPMCAELLLMNGIRLPAMYELGYHNNNCIGCVKGKKGYWNKIRVDFPDTFNRMMKAERGAGHACIKEDYKENRKMTDKEFVDFQKAITADKSKWELKEDQIHYHPNGEIVNMFERWWINKNSSRPVFLDQLKPNAGRKQGPIVPDCGSMCEIKFVDIIDPQAREIYQNPKKVTQLYLFNNN